MTDFIITNKKITKNHFYKTIQLGNHFLYLNNKEYEIFENKTSKCIIIGDCINQDIINLKSEWSIEFITNELIGNFYAFVVSDDDIIITSSAFGLLPIYYINDYSVIASSVNLIKEVSSITLTESKKWIINQLLFNYQFFNDTFFNEIKLIPAFTYLKVQNDNYTLKKYFDVETSFVRKAVSWKKSIKNLSRLFIETVGKYIPKNNSIISFTGGFDGRTLVSVATHNKNNFQTFSYGKLENDDVSIPLKNSEELKIPYFWLNLDKKYAEENYLTSSLEYIKNTNGANGFLYAHVDYSAKKINEKSSYLMSGICGSELFRASHHSGAVTSKALIDLFKYNSFEEYKVEVSNSDMFRYIDKLKFENEIQEVIKQTWDYKINLPATLSKNEKLYVFVYEEIFRKHFGAWITTQMKYLKVRTPFIDFEFFKELIKTELSGAYSDFLTKNPLKRFKGQVLYSDIIKNSNNIIYSQKTGKGYAPKIVREALLRPFLFYPFLIKRLKRKVKQENLDNLGIISGILENRDKLMDLLNEPNDLFDINKLQQSLLQLTPYTPEKKRDNILQVLSIVYYSKMIQNEKNNITYRL